MARGGGGGSAKKNPLLSSASKKKPPPPKKRSSEPRDDSDDDSEDSDLQDPTPKKKKKKTGAPKQKKTEAAAVLKKEGKTPTKGVGRKAPNFTLDEDVFLCKAYVAASEDPRKGTDQSAEDFWKTVLMYYNSLREKENDQKSDDEVLLIERDASKIKGRFMKEIQPKVNKFNFKYLKPALDLFPSGVKDIVKYACEEWKKVEGKGTKVFHLVHCLEPLQSLPKFNIKTKVFKERREQWMLQEQLNEEAMVMDISSGVGLVGRPIGQKAAKLENRVQQAHRHAIAASDSSMDKMADSMNRMEAAFNERNYLERVKQAEEAHKNKLEAMKAEISVLQSCPGFEQDLIPIIKEMQELRKAGPKYPPEPPSFKLNPSNPSPVPPVPIPSSLAGYVAVPGSVVESALTTADDENVNAEKEQKQDVEEKQDEEEEDEDEEKEDEDEDEDKEKDPCDEFLVNEEEDKVIGV